MGAGQRSRRRRRGLLRLLDHRIGAEPSWRQLCDDVADTLELCALGDRHLDVDRLGGPQQWARAAERASELRLVHPVPAPHELGGPEVGLDLGL